MSQDVTIKPWTMSAKAKMIEDLHVVFAATLVDDEEAMCDFEGRLEDRSVGRSRFASDILGTERGRLIYEMVFAVARPDDFQVVQPEQGPALRTNLMTKFFRASEYSSHQRIAARDKLPVMLQKMKIPEEKILAVLSHIQSK